MSRHPDTGSVRGRDHAATRLFSSRGKHEGDEGGMTITLTYTRHDGTQEQVEYEDSVTEVDLSRRIIASIDLSPLSACASLQYLRLGGNQLQSIDLTPLSPCASLHELRLGDHTQGTSWLSLRSGDGHYHRPEGTYPWAFLHDVVDTAGEDRRLQQDVLQAMGLGDYGFMDADLRSIPPGATLQEAQDQVGPELVRTIARAAEDGGCTTGLELETLVTRHGEVAVVAEEIIRAREAEVERVRVGVSDDVVDLKELYLTAYGYQVLSALELRLETDLEGLRRVQQAFSELGYDVKTAKGSVPGVKMSKKLREAIWWIVENRGRPWR